MIPEPVTFITAESVDVGVATSSGFYHLTLSVPQYKKINSLWPIRQLCVFDINHNRRVMFFGVLKIGGSLDGRNGAKIVTIKSKMSEDLGEALNPEALVMW